MINFDVFDDPFDPGDFVLVDAGALFLVQIGVFFQQDSPYCGLSWECHHHWLMLMTVYHYLYGIYQEVKRVKLQNEIDLM